MKSVSASPLVKVSNGPSQNTIDFYSTSYSTVHNRKAVGHAKPSQYDNNDLISTSNKLYTPPKIDRGGVVPKSQIHIDRSGYSHNVVNHIEYDPKIDEKDASVGFYEQLKVTTNRNTYPAPPVTHPAVSAVHFIRESGFTKMNAISDEKIKIGPTETQSQYSDVHLDYKDGAFQKKTIVPSTNTYEVESQVLKCFGDVDAKTEYKPWSSTYSKLPLHAAGKPSNVLAKTEADAFTRSFRKVIEGPPHLEVALPQLNTQVKTRTEPIMFIEHQDPYHIMSTTKILHDPSHSLHLTNDPLYNIKVGKKALGDVVNNETRLRSIIAPNDNNVKDEFTTEVKSKYVAPSNDQFSNEVHVIRDNAFSLQNVWKETKPAPADIELYQNLHPTLARHQWNQERPKHTLGPQSGARQYMLQLN